MGNIMWCRLDIHSNNMLKGYWIALLMITFICPTCHTHEGTGRNHVLLSKIMNFRTTKKQYVVQPRNKLYHLWHQCYCSRMLANPLVKCASNYQDSAKRLLSNQPKWNAGPKCMSLSIMYQAHAHVSLQASKQLHMQAKEPSRQSCSRKVFNPAPTLPSLTREATCFPKILIMPNMDHINPWPE